VRVDSELTAESNDRGRNMIVRDVEGVAFELIEARPER
jgi:hypothetical protein